MLQYTIFPDSQTKHQIAPVASFPGATDIEIASINFHFLLTQKDNPRAAREALHALNTAIQQERERG